LLRTHKTRPVGGALVLVLALVLSLCVGALGGSAQADDPQPSPASSDPAGPPVSGTDTTAGSDSSTAAGSESPGAVQQIVGGPVAAGADEVVWRRGVRGSVSIGSNDTCPSSCTYLLVSKPTAWPRPTITSSGIMTLSVPRDTVPGTYRVYYRITESNPAQQSADGVLTVRVTPDSYGAPSGVVFSHPYRKRYRYKIRDRILRTINSVPPGGRIQVASWSFSSKGYLNALNDARRRGVVVQIVLAQRNHRKNSDYYALRKRFGSTITPNGSWVKKCVYSCRGRSGTMHSKIFLFSSSFRTPYVMMTGSANLTDFAVTNQWNQVNTVSGPANKAIYDEGVRIFNQMVRDRQAVPMYVETAYPTLTSYYYPTTSASTSTDFMYKALRRVHCRGATNTSDGRTTVKIAMYAWYQQRGQWLAKLVRSMWQQGCNIQIVYGISSDPVKKILYSPSGRGRIPMRQILLTNTKHVPIYYIHDKWVAIRGSYGRSTGTAVSFQGSFNFSDLGFKSDEQFQMLPGSSYYAAFNRDFTLLWKDRQARAPSPISKIPTIEGRYSQNDLRLGTGTYRYMDAD
jgi:hypothetical protein